MAKTPRHAPTAPKLTLEFQLSPLQLVRTEFDPQESIANMDPPGPRRTSNKKDRDRSLEKALKWEEGKNPKGIKAFALAFVRCKRYEAQSLPPAGDWLVLSGGNGSPAFTLAGVVTDTDSTSDVWVGEFCGYSGTKCALCGFLNAKGYRAGTDQEVEIQFDAQRFPPANITIVVTTQKVSASATLTQLIEIERGLAALGDWTKKDGVAIPVPGQSGDEGDEGAKARAIQPRSLDLRALRPYFEHVVCECSHLPLAGIDKKAANPEECDKLDLANVYIDLGTHLRNEPTPDGGAAGRHRAKPAAKSPAEREGLADQAQPLSALEAVAKRPRLVLTGPPGSGKTTFTRHFSLCFARRSLSPDAAPPKGLAAWPKDQENFLVPIVIELRRYVRSLPNKLPTQPGARDLWEFYAKTLSGPNRSGINLEALAPNLEEAVAAGRAVVFLEGLDEVPTGEQRDFARRAVIAFAEADRFKASRVVLTCRTRAYSQRGFALPRFAEAPLAGFTPDQIRGFILAWYREIAPLYNLERKDADRRAADLCNRIRIPSLWELAPTPLLLTVMAHVHSSKNELPETRAKVYAEMVDILLSRWDNVRLNDIAPMKSLLAEVGRDSESLRRALSKLAFELRGNRQNHPTLKATDYGDIRKHELLEGLKNVPANEDYNWANRAIQTIEERAGLIAPDALGSDVFTFPHPSFQEYLAGVHLADQDDPVAAALRLTEPSGYWDETILWAAGYTVHVNTMTRNWRDVRELADALRAAASPGSSLRRHHAVLAGEILLEAGRAKLEQIAGGLECLERVRQQLVQCANEDQLTPKDRESTAIVLARMGDPRPGVGLRSDRVPDIGWIEIAPGPFIMGSKKGETKYDDETPQFSCTLIQQPYWISRYPITVEQYQAFVEAEGYEDERFWTKAGWMWRTSEKIARPQDDDSVYQTLNHPRVGVSWHEAIAFCRWLSGALTQDVRLPSEAEWERAARHTDGRAYPWGSDAPTANHCNWNESGIGHPSAVGLFPKGNAECGGADLAGNVLEWCRTPWLPDYRDYERKVKKLEDDLENESARVLRGGSWVNDVPVYLVSSCRNGRAPDIRNADVGFRVVSGGVSARSVV